MCKKPYTHLQKQNQYHLKEDKTNKFSFKYELSSLTVHGFRRHLLKSSNVNVKPIESMRKPKPSVKRSFSNQVTWNRAITSQQLINIFPLNNVHSWKNQSNYSSWLANADNGPQDDLLMQVSKLSNYRPTQKIENLRCYIEEVSAHPNRKKNC